MDVLVSYHIYWLTVTSGMRVSHRLFSLKGKQNLNTLVILLTIWKGFLKFVPGICGFEVRLLSILREGKLT